MRGSESDLFNNMKMDDAKKPAAEAASCGRSNNNTAAAAPAVVAAEAEKKDAAADETQPVAAKAPHREEEAKAEAPTVAASTTTTERKKEEKAGVALGGASRSSSSRPLSPPTTAPISNRELVVKPASSPFVEPKNGKAAATPSATATDKKGRVEEGEPETHEETRVKAACVQRLSTPESYRDVDVDDASATPESNIVPEARFSRRPDEDTVHGESELDAVVYGSESGNDTADLAEVAQLSIATEPSRQLSAPPIKHIATPREESEEPRPRPAPTAQPRPKQSPQPRTGGQTRQLHPEVYTELPAAHSEGVSTVKAPVTSSAVSASRRQPSPAYCCLSDGRTPSVGRHPNHMRTRDTKSSSETASRSHSATVSQKKEGAEPEPEAVTPVPPLVKELKKEEEVQEAKKPHPHAEKAAPKHSRVPPQHLESPSSRATTTTLSSTARNTAAMPKRSRPLTVHSRPSNGTAPVPSSTPVAAPTPAPPTLVKKEAPTMPTQASDLTRQPHSVAPPTIKRNSVARSRNNADNTLNPAPCPAVAVQKHQSSAVTSGAKKTAPSAYISAAAAPAVTKAAPAPAPAPAAPAAVSPVAAALVDASAGDAVPAAAPSKNRNSVHKVANKATAANHGHHAHPGAAASEQAPVAAASEQTPVAAAVAAAAAAAAPVPAPAKEAEVEEEWRKPAKETVPALPAAQPPAVLQEAGVPTPPPSKPPEPAPPAEEQKEVQEKQPQPAAAVDEAAEEASHRTTTPVEEAAGSQTREAKVSDAAATAAEAAAAPAASATPLISPENAAVNHKKEDEAEAVAKAEVEDDAEREVELPAAQRREVGAAPSASATAANANASAPRAASNAEAEAVALVGDGTMAVTDADKAKTESQLTNKPEPEWHVIPSAEPIERPSVASQVKTVMNMRNLTAI